MVPIVMMFGEEVVRVICAYAPNVEDQSQRNINSVTSWLVNRTDGHIGEQNDGFEGVHRGNGIGEKFVVTFVAGVCHGKSAPGEQLALKNVRKATVSAGGNETEIDFVLSK